MSLAKQAFVPFFLGVVAALWFFLLQHDDNSQFLASVLGPGIFESIDPSYDVVFSHHENAIVIAAAHEVDDVASLEFVFAYDPDRISVDFNSASWLGVPVISEESGFATILVDDVSSFGSEDDLALIPYVGDEEAIVLSEISLVLSDGSSLALAIYNDLLHDHGHDGHSSL